jgi:hypothetical protein
MFQGFQLEMVELPEATLRVRYGGLVGIRHWT